MGKELGGVKRTERDEPIGFVVQKYMETQGNSLCSYLYLKLAKTSCFSFHLLCFFFYKIRGQEGRRGSGMGVGNGGRGGCRRQG
jgi:hypothetical protein